MMKVQKGPRMTGRRYESWELMYRSLWPRNQ